MCVCVGDVDTHAGVREGQEQVLLGSLELQFGAVGSCLAWLLGNEWLCKSRTCMLSTPELTVSPAPRGQVPQHSSLFSGSYTLSASSLPVFPKPCRG